MDQNKKLFLKPDNPLLYRIAKKIKKRDLKEKWFLDIVEIMKTTAGVYQPNNKNKKFMVGLAAPQIGYSIKLIFVDTGVDLNRDTKFRNIIFMINPIILHKSKKMKSGREGCYSTNIGFCDVDGIVKRYEKIKVKYMNLDGKEIVYEFEGFTSVIVQHEIDHINGKVLVHRIKKEKDLHILFPSEVADYRKNYRKWKRTLDPKIYWKDIVGKK